MQREILKLYYNNLLASYFSWAKIRELVNLAKVLLDKNIRRYRRLY